MGNKPKPLHPKNKSRKELHLHNLPLLKKKFLQWVRKAGVIGYAAAKIDRTAHCVMLWRKDDPDFDQAVIEAYEASTDRLRASIYSRAMNKKDKHSALLSIFEMKRRDPAYRDRVEINNRHTMNHTGKISVELRAKLAVLPKESLQALAENLKKQWETQQALPSISTSST